MIIMPASSILLQTVLVLLAGISARADGSPTYELCKGEHTECRTVAYTAGDQTKGQPCRNQCLQQKGELTEEITVHMCDRPDQSCSTYGVYGPVGFSGIFERHVACVKACQQFAQNVLNWVQRENH
ncbi:hypothetical protein SprV_0100490400 [Sparganum proliferum]